MVGWGGGIIPPGWGGTKKKKSITNLESVDHACALLAGRRLREVQRRELLKAEVRVLVVSEGEGRVPRIVGLDQIRVGREGREALGELGAGELQPVLLDVGEEIALVLLTGVQKLPLDDGQGGEGSRASASAGA